MNPEINIKKEDSDENKVVVSWSALSDSDFTSIRVQIREINQDDWSDISNGWESIEYKGWT